MSGNWARRPRKAKSWCGNGKEPKGNSSYILKFPKAQDLAVPSALDNRVQDGVKGQLRICLRGRWPQTSFPVPSAEQFPFPIQAEAGAVFYADVKTGVSELEDRRHSWRQGSQSIMRRWERELSRNLRAECRNSQPSSPIQISEHRQPILIPPGKKLPESSLGTLTSPSGNAWTHTRGAPPGNGPTRPQCGSRLERSRRGFSERLN